VAIAMAMLDTLNSIWCHRSGCRFCHRHCIRVATQPISNASGRLSSTIPNRMKINRTESAPVIAGSATFKREAAIESAK
jgi:hypothetical protein